MLLDSEVCDLETKKSYLQGSEIVDLSELARSEVRQSKASLERSRQSILIKGKKKGIRRDNSREDYYDSRDKRLLETGDFPPQQYSDS